eukprot:XP_027303554.1 von Willebrand factor A domain-containing protein 2 [Anas platyrhynchos]
MKLQAKVTSLSRDGAGVELINNSTGYPKVINEILTSEKLAVREDLQDKSNLPNKSDNKETSVGRWKPIELAMDETIPVCVTEVVSPDLFYAIPVQSKDHDKLLKQMIELDDYCKSCNGRWYRALVLKVSQSTVKICHHELLATCIQLCFLSPQVLSKSKNVEEIHADQETIGKISAADQPAVDILFLLDGSSSVGSSGFNNSKHFAGKLCDALDIDPDRVHVGLIQFTSTPCIEFPLDSYQNKQEVEERIQSTRFRGGRKKIKQALKCILHKGFPVGRNSTVPEILFIISNGKSSNSTTTLATQLKERITIFTVEIESQGLERLCMLASEPTEQHVFSVEDADGAINSLYSVPHWLHLQCHCPRPLQLPAVPEQRHLCPRGTGQIPLPVPGRVWRRHPLR